MYLLKRLPRNIDTLARMPKNGNGAKPEVKIFSPEELKAIWTRAPSRIRCFIALALNCGFGAKDLSDLCLRDIDWKDGYIERTRVKPGVQSNHRLWQATLDLLKKHKRKNAQPEDRVFLTSKGFPLVRRFHDGERAKMSDSVHNAFWRILKDLGLAKGRGFYCLRRTGATMIEAIDPLVTEMYLAHSEPGMKKAYAQRDWKQLGRALVKLEKKIPFKL